ncbi:hypothetical protein [Nocardia heshunensis]
MDPPFGLVAATHRINRITRSAGNHGPIAQGNGQTTPGEGTGTIRSGAGIGRSGTLPGTGTPPGPSSGPAPSEAAAMDHGPAARKVAHNRTESNLLVRVGIPMGGTVPIIVGDRPNRRAACFTTFGNHTPRFAAAQKTLRDNQSNRLVYTNYIQCRRE